MFSTAILMKPSAISSGVRPPPTSFGERREAGAHRVVVERLVLRGPKIFGKKSGISLPSHHIGVGDGERAAAAVAGRARIGAGAVRADAEARAVEMQDRAAAGRDRVDAHHRRAHAHARDFGLERALVLAVEMRHVGRGAAHVEADDVAKPASRPVSAMPTTPPAGPDRIASLPWNSSAAVSPPDDIMNISRVLRLDARLPSPLRGRVGRGKRLLIPLCSLTPPPQAGEVTLEPLAMSNSSATVAT